MNILQVPDPQKVMKPASRDGVRKVYTSHSQQIPNQLSYQSIKLANFIELQLTDLWDSLQQINQENFKNYIKECLSRSYNAFHEMKKLYSDLGMNFLYHQSKKLISSYGLIFVYLLQKLDKQQKKQPQRPQGQNIVAKTNQFDQQIKNTISNMIQRKTQKQTKNFKRLRGIHLFNQSYARCMDYDIELIRQMRQKAKETEMTEQQKNLKHIEEQRRLKKDVVDQLNDYSHLKVDGDELYVFLNRYKKMNETGSKISLENQLQKIAVFFKQSQHQALEFLRKEKNLENFHELTQGFNLVVSDYQTTKASQLFMIQDKIKQVFQSTKARISHLQSKLAEKQLQIQSLKQAQNFSPSTRIDAQSQTHHNFDQQMKQLFRRILTVEMMNQQLKNLMKKSNQQERKEKDQLLQQLFVKDSSLRQTRDALEERVSTVVRLERKLKLVTENLKNKNMRDPVQYFNSLSDQIKKCFLEELKQQGFLNHLKLDQRHHKSSSRLTRQSKNSQIASVHSEKKDNAGNQIKLQSIGHELRKRESSLFKRSGMSRESDQNTYPNRVPRRSKNLDHVSQRQLQILPQLQHSKQQTIRSKKVISIKPIHPQVQNEKPRVFQIQNQIESNYSQRFIHNPNNNDIINKLKGFSRANSIIRQVQETQGATLQVVDEVKNNQKEEDKRSQHQDKIGERKSHKGIIKMMNKQQRPQNKSIKIIEIENQGAKMHKNYQLTTNKSIEHKIIESCGQKEQNKNTRPVCRTISGSSSKSKSVFRSRKAIKCEEDQQIEMYLRRKGEDDVSFQSSRRSIRHGKGNVSGDQQLYGDYATKYDKQSLNNKYSLQNSRILRKNLNQTQQNIYKSKGQQRSKSKKKLTINTGNNQEERKQNKTGSRHFNKWQIQNLYNITINCNPLSKSTTHKQIFGTIKNQSTAGYDKQGFSGSSHPKNKFNKNQKIKYENFQQRRNQIKTQNSVQNSINKQQNLFNSDVYTEVHTQSNDREKCRDNDHMRATTRKDTQLTAIQEKPSKFNDFDSRKTKTNKMGLGVKIYDKRNRQHDASKSLNSTLYKQTNRKSINPKYETLNSFNNKQSSQAVLFQNQNKKVNLQGSQMDILSMTRTNFKPQQNQIIRQLILQQPAVGQMVDQEIVMAFKISQSVEQFRNRVIKLHEKKCGSECKHLQRYLQVFIKQRRDFVPKRQIVKLHIENINQKFANCLSDSLNLPTIKK